MEAAAQKRRPGRPRGVGEQERRVQILAAAHQHFRQYGYHKTTVADLARDIGVTGAYVYRFFESKQAIGEAICAQTLNRLAEELRGIADARRSAGERLRDMYRCLVTRGCELYFAERKLHEMVVAAVEGKWRAVADYDAAGRAVLARIVTDGRKAGEFEDETPLKEVCDAIAATMTPFAHPYLLAAEEPESLRKKARSVAKLVLRSLARAAG